ncbi:AAA family ATPase [Treponema sp. C6A8]|uniref:AAA family ATPase n=1 Tax=Treponema sp. C6A8 TaxID=1410609 RepID=UPI000483D9A1|nr:AAA family ATPase [Treponema sp. C6A8]
MNLLGIYLEDGSETVIKNLTKKSWFPFVPIEVNEKGLPDYFQMKSFSDKTAFLYNSNEDENPKITINCLVGKNGAGKSALLDLLYRLINNLSYLLLGQYGYEINYAYGFQASLYFSVPNKTDCDVYCYYSNNTDDKIFKNNESCTDILTSYSISKIKNFIKKLFYTIVVNYSNYSFNQNDYLFNSNFSTKQSKFCSRKFINGKWLTSLFNKNDGYTTPLVITPYRSSSGVIDVEKEDHLAKNRIIAALLLFQNTLNNQDEYDSFIQGYKPEKLTYRLNGYYTNINQKLGNFIKRIPCLKKNYKTLSKTNIDKIKSLMITAWKEVLTERKIWTEELTVSKSERALNYLCYKTLKILSWYELYSNKLPAKLSENDYIKEFKNIINKILDTPIDHITIKIFQILNYLRTSLYDKTYTLDISKIMPYENIQTIDNYLVVLPPPFYSIDIVLTKKAGEKTLISRRSSGEKQFLYSLSYVLYHLSNLNSKNSNPKYKHILIFFDEVELYLHPDWQRLFISKLLYVIKKCCFINIKTINIVIATHSPFLLSDIPLSNVLALENGKAIKKNDMKESFCANYYDLLSNQFFLDCSIGERSRQIISRLFEIAKKGNCNLTIEDKAFLNSNSQIVDYIADPFILKSLQSLGINNVKV